MPAFDIYCLLNKIYYMATVTYFTPNCKNHFICAKGGQHEGQPLNIVCLDPLCRNDPLACSICFSQVHKYHKVSALHKFLDDYQKNIGRSNPAMLQKKIAKHHHELKQLMAKFKQNFLQQIDQFTHSLDKYAAHLHGNMNIRCQIGNFLHLELDPAKIKQIKHHNKLQKSLQFILNNCHIDEQGNMINASQVLQQNQDRVCALLDKMVYMTQFCEKTITDALSSFKFANETLKTEKSKFNDNLSRLMNSDADPISLSHFIKEKTALTKLIDESSDLIFEESQKACNLGLFDQIPTALPSFLFGKHRHHSIKLDTGGLHAFSTVNAFKPQFALAWPNLNIQPMQAKQWSIKINKCRDFASKNTMALGIARFSDLELANFQGDPKNCLLVSSQGYTSLNGKIEKTDFVYREGDVLEFKYDPYYEILEIKKPNGRKLTLKTLGTGSDPVYICARFTYASDQVELL